MSLLRFILSLVLFVNLGRAVPFSKNLQDDKTPIAEPNYRLSRDVVPSHYRILLAPNIGPDDFTFNGETDITIDVKKSTSEIVLHAKDLTISSAILLDSSSNVIPIKPFPSLDPRTDLFTIETVNTVFGKLTLKLIFNGTLRDDLTGFYRSSYVNNRGEKVWLATTHFEPTYARRAFPCFDEPAMKATFNIKIEHSDKYTAVSNMPAYSMIKDNNDLGKWRTSFHDTPSMSTYLVAFVISDFKFVSTDDAKFRVWSRDNAVHTGKYAHTVGQKLLKNLENYLGSDHVIPKMDNFAIPQFSAGAMENWGLVTYRESALLFEENVTSTEGKQRIATVMSHEFAHQWFGNLVSPSWWNCTWINEGFANYFEYFNTNQTEPTWRLMDQFVVKNLQEKAFLADDNETQHAMDATVNSPAEISSIFDSISYSKAGSVIRMFSHALGETAFQKRLRKYLSDRSKATSDTDSLLKALGNEEYIPGNKISVHEALATWTKQPGYPIVNVTRDYETGKAKISQKRFLTKATKEPKETWWIPVNYVTKGNAEKEFNDTTVNLWFDKDGAEINGLNGTEWVILNKQQTGYYRVNYDQRNWMLIAKDLQNTSHTKIPPLNRAQLLDDSFSLVQAGQIPSNYSVFLEITKYLTQEVDFIPWHVAFRALFTLDRALANTEKYGLFKLYVLRLTEKLEKKVGYIDSINDTHVDRLYRGKVINISCSMGSEQCLNATYNQLVMHVDGVTKISPDLRDVVLCAGFRTANEEIFEKMMTLAVTSTDSTERKAILNGLGCSHDVNILKKYLNLSVNETLLTRAEVIEAIYTNNELGVDVVFDFIQTNYENILKADGNHTLILKYVKAIAKRMTNVEQVEKLKKFIESLSNKDLVDGLKEAQDSADKNIEWLQKYESQIATFLKDQKLVETPEPNKPSSSNVFLPNILVTGFIVVFACIMRFY